MLRAIVKQKIYELLETTYFGIENFNVEFNDVGLVDDTVFIIKFLGDLRFSFILERNEDGRTLRSEGDFGEKFLFLTKEIPGVNYVSTETFICKDISNVLGRLNNWTSRVRVELLASNPLAKEVSTLREQLEEHLAGLGQEANNFFTKDEAAELEERLTAFSARLDKLAAENDSLKDSVAGLKQTVSDLQGAVELLNKGTWLRMAAGRVLSGLKKIAASKGVQDIALEAVRKLLLPGPQ